MQLPHFLICEFDSDIFSHIWNKLNSTYILNDSHNVQYGHRSCICSSRKNVANEKSTIDKSTLGENFLRYADITTRFLVKMQKSHVCFLSTSRSLFSIIRWHSKIYVLHNQSFPFWTNSQDLRYTVKQIILIQGKPFIFKIDWLALCCSKQSWTCWARYEWHTLSNKKNPCCCSFVTLY